MKQQSEPKYEIFVKKVENIVEMVSRLYTMSRQGLNYNFVPFNTGNALNLLLDVKKYLPDNCKFLDIGCGVGNIMALAKYVKMDVYGIDCNQHYLHCVGEVFELLFNDVNERDFKRSWDSTDAYGNKNYDAHLFTEQICLINPKIISDMDVIYSYVPTTDQKQLKALNDIIEKHTKPGCVIIFVGHSLDAKRFKPFHNIHNCSYKPISKTK